MARFGKIGWILGLIFGAVFGILFAPRKGKELRAKIKEERKKGKFGLAPLHQDIKCLGQQLADIAKDIYESDSVQDVVAKGRKKIKDLSDDLVGEAADFQYSRIDPVCREIEDKVEFAKSGLEHGRKKTKAAKKEFRKLKQKVKHSVKIGKRAAKAIQREIKRK